MKTKESTTKFEFVETITDLYNIVNNANALNRTINKSKNIYRLAREYTDKDIKKGKPILIKEMHNNRRIGIYTLVSDFDVKDSELLTYATRRTLVHKKGSTYIKSLKKNLLAQVTETVKDMEKTLEASEEWDKSIKNQQPTFIVDDAEDLTIINQTEEIII